MAVRITVSGSQRVIVGRCEKLSKNYDSTGTNDGHEWEARAGLELDLDHVASSDAAALHGAITGYQQIVRAAVKSELKRMGAPAALVDAAAADVQTTATPAQAPAPAPSQAPTAQPAKKSAAWGGPKKPAPEPEPESDDDGPPPKNGKQLLAWAHKQKLDMADWVFNWARTKKRGKVVDFNEKTTTECHVAAKKALAEQLAEMESEDES